MNARFAALLAVLLCPLAQAQGNRCPNVLLVFDASGSMGANVSGTNKDRFDVGREAVASILANNTQKFRYGLELFGLGTDGCAVSDAACSYPSPSTCQSVQCEYSTATHINTVLNLASADGLTPTGPAMTRAVQRADMKDGTRKRFVVLITDGDPNGCSSGDDYQDALNALNAARNAGVKTYVLGFAGGTRSNLNAMAQAGGTARNNACSDANPCFYDASNTAEFNAALQAIINAVGGELGGGGACDDSCYTAGGCPAGSLCKAGACVADPCASVTCGAGTVCVEGQCRGKCAPACKYDEVCDNGVCLKDAPCTQPCTARNQVCIGGACVEDYCSGNTYALGCDLSAGELCVKNACQAYLAGPGQDGGTGADGGQADGGRGGGITTETAGCCAGAPDAFSLFGLMAAVATLAGRRRVR